MNQQAVMDAVTPVVEALGLEIDRVETAPAGRRTVLRIFLDGDGPEGHGPTLDEIAQATRAISVALDESPAVGNAPYVLEVSSRGVKRPLTEPKHFRRNTGRLVALRLVSGEKPVGRVLEAGAEGVLLAVEGVEREVPYADIDKAVVQVELNKLPPDDEPDLEGHADDEEE